MRCPYCSHDETQVAETRESDEGDVVRRRRRCLKCDKRFTTYERAEMAFPSVVKKSGARVGFAAAIERIQDKLIGTGLREVPSTRVGELVMRELKRLDKVAYVRFASVYRSFEDVDEFSRLIKDI